VLATYEAPLVLDASLRAFSEQSDLDFEIVVADDGSGASIREVVDRWRERLRVRHVWQEDDGFRKARALNLAALEARGDYFAFLDVDCLPRRRFIESLRRGMLAGWFLATKRLNLSPELSRSVVEDGKAVWRWSPVEWLVCSPSHLRRPGYLVSGRDRRRPWRRDGEFVPPWHAYCLVGVARDDFEHVNGFDARCRRSDDGEDQDLAIRLRRSGLKCGWAGPQTTVLHLWHEERGDRVGAHTPLFRETEASTRCEAVVGIRELRAERGAFT